MGSSFTWLDYSERERRQVRDVLDLFREQDTRDELGVGTIRDAFADLLFPGTTTIMTRARYFLFIPWIYLRLEEKRAPSGRFAVRVRQDELYLSRMLLKAGETEGVIGRVAGDHLQRLPSNIYWLGLGSWGIRLYPGGQDEYHRSIDSFYASVRGALATREEDSEEFDVRRNWHGGIPDPPPGFPEAVSLELTEEEAEYLCERIAAAETATGEESLLAYLAREGRSAECAFAWLHPQTAEFPPHIQRWLVHVRNFAEGVHGAALLYNLMLAQLSEREDLADHYRGRLDEWALELDARGDDTPVWDRQDFWRLVGDAGASVGVRTRRFVDAWLDLVADPATRAAVADDGPARELIRKRERQLKGPRARLHSRRALENWNGAAGTARLNFRWHVVSRLLDDIYTGLERDARSA